jgi:RND superfamily putative drug exporter
MLVIAAPALSVRLGLADAGNDPAGTTTRTDYDLLAEGFGKGFNGPLLIVTRLPRTGGCLTPAMSPRSGSCGPRSKAHRTSPRCRRYS